MIFDNLVVLLSERKYAVALPLDPSWTESGATPVETTTYSWNATQQASKTTFVSGQSTPTHSSDFSYGATGQLERVVTTTADSAGVVQARTSVEYRYDHAGVRFVATDRTDTDLNTPAVEGSPTGKVEYLVDHHNFTGYAQAIAEISKNASDQMIKRLAYTYGLDEITQSTTDYNAGTPSTTSTLTFGHDARGSVRALFDDNAVLSQAFVFSAYGNLLGVANGSGSLLAHTEALTTILYNGESYDSRTGLYNFRARWYSPTSGRLDRLDPFIGDEEDPFSFNKYGMAHGDTIQGADPSGNEFSIAGMMSSINVSLAARGISVPGVLGALKFAFAVSNLQEYVSLAITIVDAGSAAAAGDYRRAIKALTGIDADEIKKLKSEFVKRGLDDLKKDSIQTAINAAAGGAGPLYFDFGLPEQNDEDHPGKLKRGKIGAALELVKNLAGSAATKTNYGQEKLGEFGTYLMANLLGFNLTDMDRAHWKYGPDFIFRHDTYQDFWAVVEAKGGTNTLGSSTLVRPKTPTATSIGFLHPTGASVQQMGARWIEFWLRHTIDKNRNNPDGIALGDAFDDGNPMLAMVVSLNLDRKQEVKIGMQAFVPETGIGFNAWSGL